MAPETFQMHRAGSEGVEKVEAAVTAAGTFAGISVKADNNGRHIECLGQTGSRDPNNTLMPVFVGQHDWNLGFVVGQNGHGLFPYIHLQVLTVAVQFAKLAGKYASLGFRLRQEELGRYEGLAQAPGGVLSVGQARSLLSSW